MTSRRNREAVRKVYAEQEKARAEQLARFNAERRDRLEKGPAPARIRSDPSRRPAAAEPDPEERLRFERFFQRMAETVEAQEVLVKRLSRAMQNRREAGPRHGGSAPDS